MPKLDLQELQRWRKQVLALCVVLWGVVLLFTASRWSREAPQVHVLIQHIGVLFIAACVLGRTWCTLYIGGHKKRQLISLGPYSMVRNPLYVFTLLGVFGMGAQSGSLLLAALMTLATLGIFAFVVRQEEAFLAGSFGADFQSYAARVPRFWPRLSQWRDPAELIVQPRLVHRTFVDACLFFLAVPATMAVEWARTAGEFPVLLYLP